MAFKQGQQRDKPEEITLEAFCKDWLKTRRPELKPASIGLYSLTIKRLLSYFGRGTYLQEISPQRAAAFVADQRNLGMGHEGEELSGWSREQIKRQCKTMFGTAVQWGLLNTSPFAALRSTKLAPKRWHRVTVKEYHRLLEAAPTLRWKVFYALAYTSGARMGELFSMAWSDIDFENSRLIIANREGTGDMPPFQVKGPTDSATGGYD